MKSKLLFPWGLVQSLTHNCVLLSTKQFLKQNFYSDQYKVKANLQPILYLRLDFFKQAVVYLCDVNELLRQNISALKFYSKQFIYTF